MVLQRANPIPNITRRIALTSTILKTDNQDQTAKELSFLEQLSDYVQSYRFFNSYFGNPSDRTTIPPSEPLIHGQPYLLFIDISPERKGLDEEPTPFPDQALAQVWNDQETLSLDVVVTSKDFSIDATVKPLTLPRVVRQTAYSSPSSRTYLKVGAISE
jgi:hypothetical protein